MKSFLFSIFVLALVSTSISFNDYQISCEKFVRCDSLQLDSLKGNERGIDAARYQWELQKNHFGCHYFIIEWGCGSSCQMYAVFNQKDGKFIGSFNTSNGCKYQKDSRLIIINADPYFESTEKYMIIEDNKLKELIF